MNDFNTHLVTEADEADWRALFNGYAEFYDVEMTEEIAGRVWFWLLDPTHVMEGFLVRDANGRAVGLAHVRACPRSLAGGEMGFLDDLFVHPDARGSGAADALFETLKERAEDRGWPSIRWITQHFNERGRSFYDKYTGGPSDFIMYQWKLE